jgi:ribonuclease E
MSKQIIIAEQYRTAAVFSEDRIEEIIVAMGTHQVGDIYMGVVENILVSIDAAFVNIGDGDRNGFIHVTDLGPLRLRRSGGSISDLLHPKQRVLVQVMKEPTGNKGPRLTGNVSMPGRYVVLMPFGRGVSLSKRIANEPERNRLRALGILTKPSGMGLLIRTEAEDVPEEMIIEDLENLQKQWEGIQQEASTTRFPSLLDRDNDFTQKILRDAYSDDVNRIVTDTSDGLKRVKQHLLSWGDGKIPSDISIDQHREKTSILEYFRVNAAIREALRPRVDLPSGGYIIIAPTEALTVIDVNSGSFTQSQTSRETVLWTNCEAAAEVARQIRLRNIAGVIVVDFIDMDTRRDQIQLLEEFNQALRADKSRPQIAQLTELGLVELTRKRQGQSIYELFGRPCPTCSGLGHLVHLPGESAPQSVEANVRHWESRISTKLDLAENDDVDSDLTGGSEVNLVNHPSYNQRGQVSRRRKRSREPEKIVERTPAIALETKEPRESRPRPEKRLDRVERTEVYEIPPTVAKVQVPAKIVLPVIEPAIAEPVVELAPERVKRAIPRPKIEPPELITVEMTLEEQEVYAHMGISPLILLNHEIKDPRTAIVSVALPGTVPKQELTPKQEPAIEAIELVEPENSEAIEVFDLPVAAAVADLVIEPEIIIETQPLENLKEEPPIESPVESRRRRRTTAVD